jgi:hypothetical protein
MQQNKSNVAYQSNVPMLHIKTRIFRPKMIENIQCSLVGLERMMAMRAQGRHEFDDITGSGHRRLREDDVAVGPGMTWVIGVSGSGMVRVHSIAGSGRTTLLRAHEQRRVLGDKACVVNGVTGSGRGRWQCVRASTVVGNDDAEAPGRTP